VHWLLVLHVMGVLLLLVQVAVVAQLRVPLDEAPAK